MRKILLSLIILIFFSLITLTLIISTIGLETKRFNNVISQKINAGNRNLNIKLKSVKFKFDIKEISLFLNTDNPIIKYKNISLPAKNIKVYISFSSLIKSETKIEKINLTFNQLQLSQIKKFSAIFKPSNLTNFLNNNLKQGIINSEIEIYLNNDNLLENFIARGTATNLSATINDKTELKESSFKFFSDKTDILIKNFTGQMDSFKITEGDLKLKLSPEISLTTNLKSSINYNYEDSKKNFLSNFENTKNILNLKADLNNYLSINFDKTYKVKNFEYKTNGKIYKANLNFENSIKNNFLKENITDIFLENSEIKTTINSKKNITNISGKYSLNNDSYQNFNLESIIDKKDLNLKLNADFNRKLEFDLINYHKPKNVIANITLNLKKRDHNYKVHELVLKDKENSIIINNLEIYKGNFSSIKKMKVKTSNNNFTISYGKKIIIKGDSFDATKFFKFVKEKRKKNIFSKINKDIEIDLSHIIAPQSEKLSNFKLIGTIANGQFIKISSKGEFSANKFLDISMKHDKKNNKKYLEIYSDITEPLLSEYKFFNGLSGGKLLFTSIYENEFSVSKLKIEDFKVVNAPGMVKLLSLADLGGLADLAEGDGISFDTLEIFMEKTKNYLKINEILALGPSISVLMEGYQDPNITSLRGTLVPAKTLNKLISKIPVIGDIVIPKEIGEGLFGISFKMKGPPGKIKTTINPIRTITPRFIQKIVDKNKSAK